MTAIFLSLLLLTAPQAAPAPAPTPPTAPEPAIESDVSLSITAHADEVRWRQVGSISVRAWSEPPGAVIEENLTTGLPRPIPGQRTFRNIDWNLRAAATIAPPADPTAPAPDAPSPTLADGDPQ